MYGYHPEPFDEVVQRPVAIRDHDILELVTGFWINDEKVVACPRAMA